MCFLYIDLNDPLKVLSLEQHRECPGDDQCEADGVKEPALFFVVVSIDLFLDHQKCTDGDQHNADALCNADGLAEKDEREKHGQNRTRLIDRHDLVDVSDLQGMKIAEPGRTGREARQNQEKKCPSTDRADR